MLTPCKNRDVCMERRSAGPWLASPSPSCEMSATTDGLIRGYFVAAFVLAVSISPEAGAHICQPETSIKVRAGTTFTYRIRADLLESEPSIYGVTQMPDENIVRLKTAIPFERLHFGQYKLEAVNPGTTTIVFGWFYAPNNAGGPCTLTIEVEPFSTAPQTSGEQEWSGFANDPVNVFLGEFVHQPPPDLDLGGPLPLRFERYYASSLEAAGFSAGVLGRNWQHNFDVRLLMGDDSATAFLFPGRRVLFSKTEAGEWSLVSPAGKDFQLREAGGQHVLWVADERRFYHFDADGLPVSVRDRNGNQLTIEYHASGEGMVPERIHDGLGRELLFSYQGFHNLSAVSDGSRSIGVSVDFSGRLISLQNVDGHTTNYEYAGFSGPTAARLTRIVRPGGSTQVQLSYDSNGRVSNERNADGPPGWSYAYQDLPGGDRRTVVTDPLGGATTYLHDSGGRLKEVEEPGVPVRTLGYDAGGRRNSNVAGSSSGAATFTARGNRLSETGPEGQTATATYLTQTDAAGFVFELLQRIDYPDGTFAQFAYDAKGNMTWLRQRRGNERSFVFNPRGQVTEHRLRAENPGEPLAISYIHDAAGNLERIDYPDGSSREFVRDARGNPVEVGINGSVTTKVEADYSPSGRRLEVAESGVDAETYAYGPGGNLVQYGRLGQTVTATYDSNDRIAGVTGPAGRVWQRSYDALGRVTSEGVTSVGPPRLRVFEYDPASGLLSLARDEAGREWVMGYDAAGNLTVVTDPADNEFLFEYDGLGNPVRMETPEGRVRTFEYDVFGRPVLQRNGLGQQHAIGFATDGAPVSAGFPALGAEMTIERDALGRPVKFVLPSGAAWEFHRDGTGRQTAESSAWTGTATFSYTAGDLTGITFPGSLGGVEIAYEPGGRVTGREYSDGLEIAYGYDSYGRLASATPGIAFGYDAAGYLAASNGISNERDSSTGDWIAVTPKPGVRVEFACDATGRVTGIDDITGEGGVTITLDALGRPASIQRPNGADTAFTRDRDGLLTGWEHSPQLASATLEYDAAERLTRALRHGPVEYSPVSQILDFPQPFTGDATAVTDALGRVVQLQGHGFEWNPASQLRTIHKSGGGSIGLTHDAFGLLVSVNDGTTLREFVWNHGYDMPVVGLERINGVDRYAYVHVPPGHLVYRIDLLSNSRQYYHFDEAGNTLFLTDGQGNLAGAAGYSPYGLRQTSGPAADNVFTFGGRHGVIALDGRFYQSGVRVYDSVTARFLSMDPRFPLADPVLGNPYAYAAGNPLRYADPSGLSPTPVDQVAGQVSNAGALSGTVDAVGQVLRPVLEGSFEAAKAGIKAQDVGSTAKAVRALRNLDTLETVMDFTGGDAANKLGGAGKALNTAGTFAQLWGLYNDGKQAKDNAGKSLSAQQERLASAERQFLIDMRILDERLKEKKITLDQYARRTLLRQKRYEKEIADIQSLYFVDLTLDMVSFLSNGLGGFVPFYGEVRDALGFIPENPY